MHNGQYFRFCEEGNPETDIHIDGLREKFRDFLKRHFFHLSEMTGLLKVYKLGVLFISTFCGESIGIFGFVLSHDRQT